MDNLDRKRDNLDPQAYYKLYGVYPIGGGEPTAEELAAQKEEFIGSLPEGVRENELVKQYSSAGDMATALVEMNDKLNTKPAATWKGNLDKDLVNSPLLQKFPDTPEGLSEAVKSHIGLEKMLGHEKVPLPKGPEDTAGWALFKKALGIPDKPDGYGLTDAQVDESMKAMVFDKGKFQEIMLKHNATPAQAKGLWSAYQETAKAEYANALNSHKEAMEQVVNELKSDWGDAYDGNVQLGQLVINKFSDDKETADYITSVLAREPMAIKWLAKIGNQFAENKIGDFKYERFSVSPEQAQAEIQEILNDPKHPYNDKNASQKEHDAAVEYVNRLYLARNKGKG